LRRGQQREQRARDRRRELRREHDVLVVDRQRDRWRLAAVGLEHLDFDLHVDLDEHQHRDLHVDVDLERRGWRWQHDVHVDDHQHELERRGWLFCGPRPRRGLHDGLGLRLAAL
jgi:hypothetical protein